MSDIARALTLRISALTFFTAAAAAAQAASPSQNQIKVSLFGQPCVLSGPSDLTTLQNVHSISPERMPPIQSLDQTRESLERMKKTAPLPSGLEGYREKLSKRLKAQMNFLEKLAELRKTGKAEDFTKATKDAILPRHQKAFRAALKKLTSKETPQTWGPATIDSLTESYSDWIEPHPEEEFHRAIQRIGIHYDCVLEESTGAEDEGEDEEEPTSTTSPKPAASPAPAKS